MYVYKVTYLPTREFYIGLSDQPKSTFNPIKKTDPAGMFNTMGSNGTRLSMLNCEKKLVKVAGDLEDLIKLGAQYAKQYENNPSFKGLFELPKPPKPPKPKAEVKASATTRSTKEVTKNTSK